MTYRLAVRNVDMAQHALGAGILVYCIGFETRSRFVVESKEWRAENILAIEYVSGQTLSFGENKSLALRMGVRIVSDSLADGVERALAEMIYERKPSVAPLTVTVDVSAMDRSVMARVLAETLSLLREGDQLVIAYAPGAYRRPTNGLVPIRRVGPAHPLLAGEISSPDAYRIALLGIGYEYGVSLSILETHEPDMSFIFRPNGPDDRFMQSVAEANFNFDFGERNYEIIDYYLGDMAGAYDDIANIIVSTKQDSSIVCVPMGPKVLSAVMILAGLVHQPKTSVLRYSVASIDQPVDTIPDGSLVGVSVTKLPSNTWA